MTPASVDPAASRPRPATPTDVSAAIAERRRRENRRRRLLVSGVAVLLALALGLVWLVRFSPLLSARQVEVRGASMVSQDQVVEAAQVPLGTPLATLDTQPVAERVAGALAPVEKVRVTTSLPRTVRIEVTERTAVFLRQSGSQYQSVDHAGVVFASSARPTKGAVLVRTDTVDNRLLSDIATVVQSLPPQLRGQVQVVQATGPDHITLALSKGRTVVWGSAADSNEKVPVLMTLLGQKATVFDVSSPGSPSTR